MLSIEQIAARVDALKYRSSERDARANDVLAVRQGRITEVYPDFFPEGVDANVVANFIDIVARDLSEVMAPLPAINCSAANQTSDRARSFADKRTRIASNYFNHSELQVQMYQGADFYITFGFVPFIIELDEEAKLPRIRVESPVGAYPEFDRYNRCTAFAKRYQIPMGELVAQFPEFTYEILGKEGYKQDLNVLLDVVRYYDKDQSVVYLPNKDNMILSQARNPLGKMNVVVAKRPSIDGQARGQFDDVLGIQLLRNRFALLAMEAAEKSVQAPIVVPLDVQEFQFGGDAVIRTNSPIFHLVHSPSKRFLTENYALVHAIQKVVLETLMQASLQARVSRRSWEHLIPRSRAHKQSLLAYFVMLLVFALRQTKKSLTSARLSVA